MTSISIKQVAKMAKVSISTASKALNDYPDVSQETRKSVQDIAARLGYIPNQSAKKLASKNKKDIAILLPGLVAEESIDTMSYNLMTGANKYVLEKGVNVAAYITDGKIHQEKALMAFCREYSLSGILLFGLSMDDPYVAEVDKATIPCVVVDIPISGPFTGTVRIDDRGAFEEITEYVLSCNHRILVLVHGLRESSVSLERYKGFCNGLGRYGLEQLPYSVLYGEFNDEIAKAEVKEYIRKHGKNSGTVFICMSDLMALGACEAIWECGYSVPEDFSVTGFDNVRFMKYMKPKISTVNQNFFDKGYQAARLLFQMVEGEACNHEVILPYQLLVGDSVKKLQ